MTTPGFARIDFSNLVATMGGGMAVQASVAERWKSLTGCPLTQGWGLTETSPVAAVNQLTGTRLQRLNRPAPALHGDLHPRR